MKPLLGLSLFTLATLSVSAEEGKLTVADLNFKFAAPWKSVESSSQMHAATLEAKVEGSDKAVKAVFYYFGAGQGGDVDANVTRWYGQFEGEPEKSREEIPAGEKKITIVRGVGTYLDGPPFGGTKTPMPNYALLGAIVPAAEANIFIKLTGPKDVILKLQDGFKKIAASPFSK